jgi:hypothetical protein
MKISRTFPPAAHLRGCAALLLILAWTWGSSREASAQLGSLIVTISHPTPGSTVGGTLPVNATVSVIGGLTVVGVQFTLDGVNLGAEDRSAPYSVSWNSRTTSNGSHTLRAVARDLLGRRWTSNPVTVTVFNDLTPPTVAITSPGGGAALAGVVAVNATASDNVGVVGVQFRLNGAPLGTEDTSAPYSVSWDTRTATNGSHTLTAVARDAAGNSSTSLAVAVTADNAAPTVGLTAPATAALLRGAVNVAASAADNAGVVGVQFRLNGAPLGAEDTTAPYGVSWDTRTATNGSHTLTAVGRDAAGNSATSTAVTVTVDNAVPAVSLTAPAAGGTVSATIAVSANAADNVGVVGVQFRLDGANLGAEDAAAPYTVSWNTSTATNGSHTLTAIARDGAGNSTTSASITVTVDNTPPDTTPPTVSITAPSSGATVSGSATLSANASDAVGVVGVQFRVDGVNVGPEDTSAPYEASWDTRTVPNGSHTITAIARDAAGNTGTAGAVSVTVNNTTADTTPPSVSITAPSPGATVSDTVTLSATASDNVGVVGVQFRVDGVNAGPEDTSTPFAASWDTRTAPNGSHTIVAIARDAAGNTATSGAVTVTVANTTTTTRIEETSSAIAYTGAWIQGNTNRPWSGGTAALGFAPGHIAQFTFTGTAISWIGFRSPQAGIAHVSIDGGSATIIDGYAETETIQAVMFTASGLANGTHVIRVETTGNKNPAATEPYVVVDAFDVTGTSGGTPPDTTPPTVGITSPTAGATVSGTVPINATAADDTGVASVAFFVDGTQVGATDAISPYSAGWDTRTVADGSHTLTAIARDAAGNSTASAPVTVTVSNAAPPPVSSATRIENTSLSIIYTDGCLSCGQPPEWFHGSRSRDWSGATASFNRADGARATFSFTGTAITWISFTAPWAGIARIYVDGTFVQELDLYSPTEQARAPVFQMTGLTPAVTHTIAIESTGRKNAAATDFSVVVDAFDVSPPSPPPTEGTRSEETAASVTLTAGWTRNDTSQPWSGGTAAASSTAGDRATFVFTGTSIRWIGRRAPNMGIARVYLDGAFHAEADMFAPTSLQEAVFTIVGLEPAQHRLEIEVTGVRRASSTGTAIVVDAFDVRSRVEDNDVAVAYSGAWAFNMTNRNWSGTSLSMGSGTAARSAEAGSRADFTFTGTSVSWISLKAPWGGIADVYLDGVFAARVDLYDATEQLQVPVFTRSGLTAAAHTLRIEVTGLKNDAASTALVVVDAFDVTIPTPAPPVTRVQENDSRVAYSGTWDLGGRSPLWTGEDARQAGTVGATATFTFTGTSVRWVGVHGFGTGIARVSLDGQVVATIDTRTALQEEFQREILKVTGLAAGTHTLRIEVLGRNNEPPGATVDRIVVDAFDIK